MRILEEEIVFPAGSLISDEPGEQDSLKEAVLFDDGEGAVVVNHFHNSFNSICFQRFFQRFECICAFCELGGLWTGHSRYFGKEAEGLVYVKDHAMEDGFDFTFLGDACTKVDIFRSLEEGFCGRNKDEPAFFIVDFHFFTLGRNISESPVTVPVDFEFRWRLALNGVVVERCNSRQSPAEFSQSCCTIFFRAADLIRYWAAAHISFGFSSGKPLMTGLESWIRILSTWRILSSVSS